MSEHPTSFARWSLVVHKVTQKTAEIWVGSLFPTLQMPEKARIRLLDKNGAVIKTKPLNKADWQRPFRKHNQRFFYLHKFTGLQPGTFYGAEFQRKVDGTWQTLKDGCLDTLPEQLPAAGDTPFTIGLGSCFYNHRDGGQAAASFKALYNRGIKPDLTFLVGDQVYLDIGFDSLSVWPSEIRQRILPMTTPNTGRPWAVFCREVVPGCCLTTTSTGTTTPFTIRLCRLYCR